MQDALAGRVLLLLEVLGAMTVVTGIFMVASRIVHGHWPACGF